MTTIDDYRRQDPAYRVRVAARMLRKAALKPGEPAPTPEQQAEARERALAALRG